MRLWGVGVLLIGCGGAPTPKPAAAPPTSPTATSAPSSPDSELVCPTKPEPPGPLASKPFTEGGYERLDESAVATFRATVKARATLEELSEDARNHATSAALHDLMPEIKQCMAQADPVVPNLQYSLEFSSISSPAGSYLDFVKLHRITDGASVDTAASDCVKGLLTKLALPPASIASFNSTMTILRYDECTPKVFIAKGEVQAYAHIYWTWSAGHPNQTCPARLADLSSNLNLHDPWGRRYELLCGATLPRGAAGIGVMSGGRDGITGTDDDVESWDTQHIVRGH